VKFDGVIFDLDGTLWDSTKTVAESWNATMKRHGYRSRHFDQNDIAGIMGLTAEGIAAKLFPGFGEKGVDICGLCCREEVEYIRLYGGNLFPGLEEMLMTLQKQARLFIVSNCYEGYIESFLEYFGFAHYFTDFAHIGRPCMSKAENISHICRLHDLKSPVYIGDTPGDEKSAAAAGCPFVHAGYGFGRAESPLAAAACPGDIPGILKSL